MTRLQGGAAGNGGPALVFLPLAYFPAWQRQRAKRLHRIFLTAEKRVAKGVTLWKAFEWTNWISRRENYQDGKRVRLRRGTLYREFTRWKNGGRRPEAVTLHFASARTTVPPALALRFLRGCFTVGVTNCHAAWRAMPRAARGKYPFHVVRRTLPVPALEELQRLHLARRQAASAEFAAIRFLEKYRLV